MRVSECNIEVVARSDNYRFVGEDVISAIVESRLSAWQNHIKYVTKLRYSAGAHFFIEYWMKHARPKMLHRPILEELSQDGRIGMTACLREKSLAVALRRNYVLVGANDTSFNKNQDQLILSGFR